jgi:hypothetical protein
MSSCIYCISEALFTCDALHPTDGTRCAYPLCYLHARAESAWGDPAALDGIETRCRDHATPDRVAPRLPTPEDWHVWQTTGDVHRRSTRYTEAAAAQETPQAAPRRRRRAAQH